LLGIINFFLHIVDQRIALVHFSGGSPHRQIMAELGHAKAHMVERLLIKQIALCWI
jgi:hypothetical protein